MKLLLGLLILGLFVSDLEGRRMKRPGRGRKIQFITRKCEMSGVTLPTCESEEKMRIAFTTCEDVQNGTYFKKGKVSNSK